MKKLIVFFSLCLLYYTPLYAGSKDPSAVLFQVKGKVEYTRNGKSWRKVRRNKFLFDGYQVKTGANGYGKVTIKKSGENFELSPNSLFEVKADEVVALEGSISAVESSGKLATGLIKKFDKSQSYTTVRRSFSGSSNRLKAVRNLKVSDDYPYLVWDNYGDTISYQVQIGTKTYDVPASTDEFVKFKLDKFEGELTYDIAALENGKTIAILGTYRKRGEDVDYKIEWASASEQESIQKEINDIQETYGDNSFMLGSYYEKKEMWVASMERYQEYLQENPEEIEMTPYLFRVYKQLQLNNTYKKELDEWKIAMTE